MWRFISKIENLACRSSNTDFTLPFHLETDASGYRLGAVLSQADKQGKLRPIAYASRTLQRAEKNYGITQLKALAIVWAVNHFRQYFMVTNVKWILIINLSSHC